MELIKVENEIGILDTEVSKKVAEFEKAIKEIKEKEEELKQNILSEMESKNILKLETDDLTITYIAPAERETFDSKNLEKKIQTYTMNMSSFLQLKVLSE